MKRLICGLAAACLAASSWAMKLQVQGDALYASGPVGDDYTQFKKALETPGLRRVVLVNSPGGDLWTGMQVGSLIEDKKLNTVIAGHCHSACAIMFMGGIERSFADAYSSPETVIGIHGPSDLYSHNVNSSLTPHIYAFLKERMGDHFNAVLIKKALTGISDSNGLLRVFDPQRELKRNTFFCPSGKTARQDCENFSDQDALTLGIVTSAQLTKQALPDGYGPAPEIAGRRLTNVLSDVSAFVAEMGAQKCSAENCRKFVADYANGIPHRAIAFPLVDGGATAVYKHPSAGAAFVAALYGCNHVKNKPSRLCEVAAVDDYDMRAEARANEASVADALAKLEVPPDAAYGGEDAAGAEASNGMRVQDLNAPTPLALEGLRTYTTVALASEIKGPTPPLIIDVWAAARTLPRALILVKGGVAYADAAQDAVYAAKFGSLLHLLAPDPAAPLVFVSTGRDDWRALNAAQRARSLGYTQVGWYRGGLASWSAAKLPLAWSVMHAVVEP